MLSKSNIRPQKSTTEASIFYYIVSEEISLFRLSPQSAPDLVRFNKLSYILSHLFPFDNLSFFHFSENFPLIYIPNILPNMLMEKGKITSHAPFTALRAVSWTARAV